MAERSVFIVTALVVACAALASGDWAAVAGVVGWLALVGALRGKPTGRWRTLFRTDSPVAALRRWRTMLVGLGLVTCVVHLLAVDRLAAQKVGTLPALLTTLLAAAIAAWLAWTQQEIRRRRRPS